MKLYCPIREDGNIRRKTILGPAREMIENEVPKAVKDRLAFVNLDPLGHMRVVTGNHRRSRINKAMRHLNFTEGRGTAIFFAPVQRNKNDVP